MDQWIVQLKKGVYELAILLLLRQKEMYGYELTHRLNEMPVFSLAEGSIYPILKRMVSRGWITSYWQETGGGPRRKYYRMTEEGERVIQQRLDDFRELTRALEALQEGFHE